MKASLFPAAAMALAVFASPTRPDTEITIEDLNLGKYWYGAQIDANDLKGKVVLVEIWGS